jgi:NADH:ubiquinone oxidoreductase subunit F (NADH-binding)
VTSLTTAVHAPAVSLLPRLLAGVHSNPPSLRAHLDVYGPNAIRGRRSADRSERFIDVVERSGLTGRGGSGFPTGQKMRAVLGRRGPAVVVANGAEGEPASCKDRLLLTRLPHLVLDGIALAAEAVGADRAYLAVHDLDVGLIRWLEHAIDQRRQLRMDPVPVRVVGLPKRYVSSEQSAIVQFINGGPAKPTFSPPRPDERGVRGRPTLVNNVETLANLALIARHGDEWFRSAGLPSAPGSMLVTVGGASARPGVYEIEMGTSVGGMILAAGGATEQITAVLLGGYFGTWLPARDAWPVPLTHADMRAAGIRGLGAGIVLPLPKSACGLAETARVLRYLAEENAGQCGPCVFGLPALADAFGGLAYYGGRGDAVRRIGELLPLVEGRGACRHPDGATQLARSALTTFADDAHWHEVRGACDGVGRPPVLPLPGDANRGWTWK